VLGSERTETAPDTRSAGITRHSGASYPRRPTRYRQSRRGRSFSGAVSGIVNRSTSGCLMRLAPTRRIGRDRGDEPSMLTAAENQVEADRRVAYIRRGRTHVALGGGAPHPLLISPSLLRLLVGSAWSGSRSTRSLVLRSPLKKTPAMRKIIAALVVSVDGFIEGSNEELDWVDTWENPFDLLPRSTRASLAGRMHPGYEQYWDVERDRAMRLQEDAEDAFRRGGPDAGFKKMVTLAAVD
jgi:hypothetical protein